MTVSMAITDTGRRNRLRTRENRLSGSVSGVPKFGSEVQTSGVGVLNFGVVRTNSDFEAQNFDFGVRNSGFEVLKSLVGALNPDAGVRNSGFGVPK